MQQRKFGAVALVHVLAAALGTLPTTYLPRARAQRTTVRPASLEAPAELR